MILYSQMERLLKTGLDKTARLVHIEKNVGNTIILASNADVPSLGIAVEGLGICESEKEVSRAEDRKSRRVEEGGAIRKQRLTRTFNIVLYIKIFFEVYKIAIPSSRKPLHLSTLYPDYITLLLLPRSATLLLWLFLSPSMWLLSGRTALFRRLLPTFSLSPIICHECIHQLLGSSQFRFRHPRVLPLDPIVPLTANHFLADDFVDFLFIIGICSWSG
jgi:hypothetical protein